MHILIRNIEAGFLVFDSVLMFLYELTCTFVSLKNLKKICISRQISTQLNDAM